MSVKIQQAHVEAGRRILVISDVHGKRQLLEDALRQAGFCDRDYLVLLGDMIEGGEDSLGCLHMAMELARRENVCVLSGNWERGDLGVIRGEFPVKYDRLKSRALRAGERGESCALSEMCRAAGAPIAEDTDMEYAFSQVREKLAPELDFMARMPHILEAGGYFFVHGGAPTMDHHILSQMQEYQLLKNDAFEEQGLIFDRWMVVGHWPVSLYDEAGVCLSPRENRGQRILSIDGGCGKKRDYQMNVVCLRSGGDGMESWLAVDDFPKVRALEDQAPGEGGWSLNWAKDHIVEMVSRRGDLVRVRSVKTGREMDVPEKWFHPQAENTYCEDITSCRLRVKRGDILSVVAETAEGLYGKRNGISGWYTGRYEWA